MTLEELQAKRAETLKKMKALNKQEMSDDELKSFESLRAEFDKFNRDIDLLKSENALKSEVDDVMTPERVESVTAKSDYIKAFDMYLAGQNIQEAKAAMSEGVDADGGYIVPIEYQKKVVQKLNEMGATRAISTVIGTSSTRNIPTEGEAPTFAWVEEEGAYGETKSTFGLKQLGAYKLGGIIKVSEELLQDNMINFEAYMAKQIAKGIDKAESPAFAVGDGTLKPTGYATSAPVGASSTTAATDAVTADELIDIFYDLPAEYRKRSTWRMTDKTEKAIRKLKDGNGNYIYAPALVMGERDAILGRQVELDPFVDTLGAGKKVICLGDFNYYYIADRGNMSMQKLTEAFAVNGLIGFKVSKRVDAKPVLSEAFTIAKSADS